MKKINLDVYVDFFSLGDKIYVYKHKEEDKFYYLSSIIKLDENIDNTSKLRKIFEKILLTQNKNLDIRDNDVVGLFHYFNSIFL